MLDRDQVLHVARLARLALTDAEVERMARELSGVLAHIEKIQELSLEGVPPTAHVVEVTNALREDEPEPCLPRELALRGAPDPAEGGFGVPSPGAAE
jgi:aspartyl-tRNA(Asn)/glutamyl-tRNA(Gln) amidotransferase subunit C